MKAPPLLLLFAGLLATIPLGAQTVIWNASPGNPTSLFGSGSNWVGGVAPGTGDIAEFRPPSQPVVTFDAAASVAGLRFSNSSPFQYPPYLLTGAQALTIGSSGIELEAITLPGSLIQLDANLAIELSASQDWTVGNKATLLASGQIFAGAGTSITKRGSGTLVLANPDSIFPGGVVVESGTLLVGASSTSAGSITKGPLGLGLLTLHNNTTLGSYQTSFDGDIVLHNAVSIGGSVNFATGGTHESDGHLTLGGNVDFTASTVALHLGNDEPVWHTGLLTGSAGPTVTLKFDSATADEFGGWVFGGTFQTGKTWNVEADQASVHFLNDGDGLPTSLKVVNGGYAGVAVVGTTQNVTAGALIAKVGDASAKANYAGTFGFDTEESRPHVFSEALDFAAFIHPNFTIGSRSSAVLTGAINPSNDGSTAQYRFGGGGGLLVIDSALEDATTPTIRAASVLVTSPLNREPQTVVFRGNNSYTGTSTTTSGKVANLVVDRSVVVLDSTNALPVGATFAFQPTDPAYVGATENAFADFASFKSRLESGAHGARSILGLDSNSYFTATIANGEDSSFTPRTVASAVDLSSLGAIYLGTASHVTITGTVTAPGDGVLRLAALNEGVLKITSSFAGTSSVVIGLPAGAPEGMGDAEVFLGGDNTYAGGTTLHRATVVLDQATNENPLGTGAVTVDTDTTSDDPEVAYLRPADGRDVTLVNDLILQANAYLMAGRIDHPADALILTGDISGTGTLQLLGSATLAGDNARSGNTYIDGNVTVSSQNGLNSSFVFLQGGTVSFQHAAPVIGTLGGENDASIALAGNSVLTVNQAMDNGYAGSISGTNASLVIRGDNPATPRTLKLSGSSSYSGSTSIANGAIVVAGNSNALGGSGTVTLDSGRLVVPFGVTLPNPIAFSGTDKKTLSGSGTFGAPSITLANGAAVAPGDFIGVLSFSGSLTWGPKGGYSLEIRGTGGAPGMTHDSINVAGTLAFDATITTSTPFTIYLRSVTGSGADGNIANFVASNSYSWKIASAANEAGFGSLLATPGLLAIDTSGFTNPLDGGLFSISTTTNEVFLNFTPIPEPSTWLLMISGLGTLFVAAMRRRRKA